MSYLDTLKELDKETLINVCYNLDLNLQYYRDKYLEKSKQYYELRKSKGL